MVHSWPGLARVVGALGVLALGACGSSRAGPPDAARADAARDDGPPDEGARDGGGGEDAAATRPPRTGAPLPAGVAPARLILDPGRTLTGGGEGSCTHQLPASGNGERWCVFTRAGTAGRTELWVINVSRAAVAVPACDGSSAACLRLHDNVWMGGGLNGPFQPYANRFFGDTLIFYADATSGAMDVHRGPVFAWRPDWAHPRRISSDRALECWGHPHALLAHCAEDVAGDPTRPDSFELRAGVIADRDGVGLPSLGRVVPFGRDDRVAWQAGFSPRGDRFALSRADGAGNWTLHVSATDQLGQAPPLEILRGVERWQIGNDGRRIFFIREAIPGAAALWVADFPSGANPIELDPKVVDYLLLGGVDQDRGVAFVSDLGPEKGAFRLAGDAAAPAALTTVFAFDRGLDGLRLSRDLRFTAWRDSDFRVNVVAHADLRSCALNVDPHHPAYSIGFLERSGLIFWSEGNGGDRDRRDGYFADPAGCQNKHRFARSVAFLVPVGDRGLVFADEVDDDSQRTTLKYAAISDGKHWPAGGPVRVHDEIDGPSVLFVGADPLLLLFRVSAGAADQQGTYLFGPLPF